MENSKKLVPLSEDQEPQDQTKQGQEEKKPMPFGMTGIQILCNVTQYAVFLGITVLILAIVKIFGPK